MIWEIVQYGLAQALTATQAFTVGVCVGLVFGLVEWKRLGDDF
jgi:hypothetical protein